MKKIDNEFEHYELLESNSGCAIASFIVIIVILIVLITWSFV